MNELTVSSLGFPRIGENREWKKTLEAFWAGQISEDTFIREMTEIRLGALRRQKEKGVELIPVGDFTFYDHMLDLAAMFGQVPERYGYAGGKVSLATYFAMARGNSAAPACEMTKWFNTNYHYIVPEIGAFVPALAENRPLELYLEAKRELGIDGKPVLIGPCTFVKLSKGYDPANYAAIVERFLPLYGQMLAELQQAGARWVQLDEPLLVATLSDGEMKLLTHAYEYLANTAPGLSIMLQTYFDAVERYEEVSKLPVAGIGLDFVHGGKANLENLQRHGFPHDKVLGVGIIDGRNIWRANLSAKLQLLQAIAAIVPFKRQIIQPSCSLLHVPISLRKEANMDGGLRNALSFAEEKLDELQVLAAAIRNGADTVAASLRASAEALNKLAHSPARNQLAKDAPKARNVPNHRGTPYEVRQKLQRQKWSLPLLPTTTIGSFPQTPEVRKARNLWRKGEWSKEQYDQFIREQIKEWIALQEEIGLDVLVHGEFERTDMVEYFGEKLAGFAFTQNGWVQSYGSRCVKPPIIYGDVKFAAPMTVAESAYAQQLTAKPVKGMLTGPVTILNWSFVRDDLPRKEVAWQIALALRNEIKALEDAGIEMIQVDEPALREGLPLKRADWDQYLAWAGEAFRVTTSSVKETTQIHTHMCYGEFHDIIEAISSLDADVISIETSRSHGELISSFAANTYDKGIGLGVYDIHSPRVPDKEEMVHMIERALSVLPSHKLWINPDCGLKTRGKTETVAALNIMVQAATEVRARLQK
ncbi:MAG TPA: 5-methyltetrahydropteroyltriglutamate--homocysteine S-methyltransferase [Bacilli bacterium]